MNQPKTVLITGASSGFGRATAELLAESGHTLVLIARREDRLDELKKTLKTKVYTASVDVTDKVQVQQFFNSLPDEYRQTDVLVNSAGLALGMGPAQESSLEDWERMVDTNIKGLLYVTRLALEGMTARGDGLIINIGSVAAHQPYKGGNDYGGTKAFVRQFSRNLRTDLLGTGVKVTTIEPGMAETEFSDVRLGDHDKANAVYAGMRPLVAADIARTIDWVVGQPDHVNIDNIEIMPADQTFGGAAVHRTSDNAK